MKELNYIELININGGNTNKILEDIDELIKIGLSSGCISKVVGDATFLTC